MRSISRRASYHYQEIAFQTFVRQQRSDCAIHGGKSSLLVYRKSQQVGIRHLLMARQALSEWFKCVGKTDLIGPEPVRGMAKVGLQQGESIRGGECVWRESGIRKYADEGGLGQWACCPPLARVARKPFLDFLMSAVGGPSHSDKDIDVQQKTGFHSNSSWSLSTSSVLIGGEPGGSSTT
jgi:hypothetical protein